MIRALGVGDQRLTVTAIEEITPAYRRIRFSSPGAFEGFDPEPASWVRVWFPDPGDEGHEVQRAYTFVDADQEAGTFSLDFVIHHPPGPATRWAISAQVGDELNASFWASTKFTPPEVEPAGYLLLGDLAGLPGLRSVVGAIPDEIPIELYIEEHQPHDRLAPLPSHPKLRIHWVAHQADGGGLARAVEQRDWTDWYAWAAAEKGAIKHLKDGLRQDHGFPKTDMKLAPYWIEGKPMGGKVRGGRRAATTDEAAVADQPVADQAVVTVGPIGVVEPVSARDTAPVTGPDASVSDPPSPDAGPSDDGPSETGPQAGPSEAEPAPAAAPGRWRSQAGKELLAPLKGTFRLAATCQAAVSVLGLVPYLLLVEVARRMLDGQQPEDLHSLATAALVILGVATTLSSALVVWLHVVDSRFTTAMKKRIVDKLGRLPLGWFTDRNSGTVRQLVVDDTAGLHYLVTHAVLDAAAAVVTPLVVLVYLFVVDARLALVLLVPLIAYGVVVGRMANASKAQIAEHGRWTRRVSAETTSYLEGAAVVRTFGDDGAAGLRGTLDGYTSFVSGWQVPLGTQKAISALITRPATFLWLIATAGTALVTTQTLSAPSLLTFLFLGVTFGPKLLGASYGIASYRESAAAAQRVGLVLTEPELAATDHPISPEVPAGGAAVRFRDVTFSYQPGRPVLHGVDLDLAAGEVTALVGPSGSGKSTLAALLARFHDVDSGSISVAGHDLRDVVPDDLRRLVGFVFQDVRLVRGSVRDNIALARPDATDEEVRAAAEAANVHRRIEAMPHGYDTLLGSDLRLSGGEAQRVSIARAILADPPVLVLDEATSFADPESERQVQQALSRLARGRTVLVIAHRLHTVVDAHRIVVLDRGRVAEQGTHAELLERNGRYAAMWTATSPTTGPATDLDRGDLR